MNIKTSLQSLSDWTKEAASATKGAVDLTLESGLLKDSLDDLCKVGGVAGAIFKLGSLAIPNPTPEQRVTSELHRAFLTALDRELKRHEKQINAKAWRRYIKEKLPEVAAKKLACQFTWLSIFGPRGARASRSWPIVGELADTGSTWIAENASARRKNGDSQAIADEARGRLHDALLDTVDKLITDPVIRQAIDVARPDATRKALEFLAQELTTSRRYRLFGEVPQEELYITPTIKCVPGEELEERFDWDKVEAQPDGDDALSTKLRDGHPALVVLQGEMGVGKSCLMRVLAARLAEQYLRDKRICPVLIRWRDVYQEPDLRKAIADRLSSDFGLPFQDIPDYEDMVYLVDGFDEMSSHQEGFLTQCFDRLAKMVQGKCTIVVAMRSTVITPALELAWKDHKALVVRVQEFTDDHVGQWATRWSERTGNRELTGEKLLALCKPTAPKGQNVAHNPLLLYMLAKYVYPTAARGKTISSRTDVFRIFVDETLRGKLRTTHENFPIGFQERDYRLLLQEIAYISSWPKYAPKCPVREVKGRFATALEDLNFDDVRTAFVLHFFEPGDTATSDFEFQPEGFRHYLLAEWCVRAQLEALREEHPPTLPLARTRDDAAQVLAQVPLRAVEREMVNDLWEELGALAREDAKGLTQRLQAFGIDCAESEAVGIPERLYARVRRQVVSPPAVALEDQKVGVPEGEGVPPALNSLRLLVNYLDQCLLATFGLYRGLGKDPLKDDIFAEDRSALGRFLRIKGAVRTFGDAREFDLSNLGLPDIELPFVLLPEVDAHGSNLRRAFLTGSVFYQANLVGTDLSDARLSAIFSASTWADGANFRGALLDFAHLRNIRLAGADLSKARLRGVGLRGADLEGANLTDAVLFRADLTAANLQGANLDGAVLEKANMYGAKVSKEQLASAQGEPQVPPPSEGADTAS